jgi:DNA-binding PadR family transcriptional regulator
MAVREEELVLPALFCISMKEEISTSELIKQLSEIFQPEGEDAEILASRNDTKFSQKVRNLVSHRTLENKGYEKYENRGRNGYHTITPVGQRYLDDNMELLQYLIINNFSYDDFGNGLAKVKQAEDEQKKIITYDENSTIFEGFQKQRNHSVYVRSDKLRKIAIDRYTKPNNHIVCETCGFDFWTYYGDLGKGYIEIHHKKPMFQYDGENTETYIEEALENVVPVCSNCHRMIHRKRLETMSIDSLMATVESRRKNIVIKL